jgi:hypothetical protein
MGFHALYKKMGAKVMERKSKKKMAIAGLILLTLSLTACVPMDGTNSPENLAGFFSGLWHGVIWLITFLMGLFTDGKYTIYETFNNGWPYNLGFLIGIGAFFGGGSSAVCHKH